MKIYLGGDGSDLAEWGYPNTAKMMDLGLSRLVTYFKIKFEKNSRQKTLLEDMTNENLPGRYTRRRLD